MIRQGTKIVGVRAIPGTNRAKQPLFMDPSSAIIRREIERLRDPVSEHDLPAVHEWQ